MVGHRSSKFVRLLSTVCQNSGMDLPGLVSKLESYAPTHLAGSWDNVGLLIEPSAPHKVSRMLLTNDLTKPVMTEAIEKKVDLILSYHPPLFTPMKTINQSSWKQRIAVKCLENRIAVFSPHTSWDAEKGKVNDWLISPFGVGHPIEQSYEPTEQIKVECTVPEEMFDEIASDLVTAGVNENNITKHPAARYSCEQVLTTVSFKCPKKLASSAYSILVQHVDSSQILMSSLSKLVLEGKGAGRITKLDTKIPLKEALEKVKTHLQLEKVRVATAVGHTLESKIGSVAVCAGSGSSVLRGVNADLFISGEMSHHEVLDAIHNKRSVILCEHSNTERGFIHQVACKELEKLLEGKVEVLVSSTDKDPLDIL